MWCCLANVYSWWLCLFLNAFFNCKFLSSFRFLDCYFTRTRARCFFRYMYFVPFSCFFICCVSFVLDRKMNTLSLTNFKMVTHATNREKHFFSNENLNTFCCCSDEAKSKEKIVFVCSYCGIETDVWMKEKLIFLW